MHTQLVPGTYVVAVSGGVDSVALLHMLQSQSGLRLVVAHYNHGIRADSTEDQRLVKDLAAEYELPYVTDNGQLGQSASEAKARKARYDFLYLVQQLTNAKGIVTAHHQDDLIETAVMNVLRGTGRHGLSSLRTSDMLVRPLLHRSKRELIEYALSQGLTWREDSTNLDIQYRRNYIRHQILPKLNTAQREKLVRLIRKSQDLNDEIDARLINHLHARLHEDRLDRRWFIHLPHAVAREVLVAWLKRHHVKNIDAKLIERLVVAAKTYQPNRKIDVDKGHVMWMQRAYLALQHTDR